MRWQQRPQTNSAWLHEEVARRMEDRLGWFVRSPQSWLHWEPVRGGLQAHELLKKRYPKAQGLVHATLPQERVKALPWFKRLFKSAPESRPVDLLWANMALHMAADPEALIGEWYEALAVDGVLMFSCFGPDTLLELRSLYKALDWPPPAHEFTDMHDWGDMLIAAGFAEPVMDMERITLTFETPERLLQELRELGRNLHPARFQGLDAGLKGKGWRERLLSGLRQLPKDEAGRLQLSFEIIYGHAMKPAAKPRGLPVAAETRMSVDELRGQLKGRKA